MNKKGFTLVELIAVIVIIALISTIVVLNFDNILGKNKTKKDNSFQDTIEKAACVYIDLDENKPTRSSCYPSSCSVTVNQLITSGLIKDDLVDPTTDAPVNKNLTVSISWDSNGTKSCSLNR